MAERIPVARGADCVLVAVDGVDGAGKTVFADELAARLRSSGRAAIRLSLDDFHHPRAIRHRRASHDVATDEFVDPPEEQALPGAVVVLDGLFLHRDELVAGWDLSIFLRVPFTVSVPRMAGRDGTELDPDHPSVARYVRGQQLYLTACAPEERAALLVDNADLAAPRLLRSGSGR